MSKGGNHTSAVLHSCSSGRVACETAAAEEERARWRRKQEAGFMEVEKPRMERCFPGFQHGRLFQALSTKLVLSWGRSKVKVTTSNKKATKKKQQQKQAGSSISFHSVPEENVSHNMDPVSPLVSCIGQVRAGGQRRRTSRRNDHRRFVSSEDKFQGRWHMCMPCSSSSCSSSSKGIHHLDLSSSVSPSNQSLISGSRQANGGFMLAKSLLLLQQQMDNQKISESSSSESSPTAIQCSSSSSIISRNQNEVCLWKRRCIPQPQSLQLTRTSST